METWNHKVAGVLQTLYLRTEGHVEGKERIHSVLETLGIDTQNAATILKDLQEMNVLRMRAAGGVCSVTAKGIDEAERAIEQTIARKPAGDLDETAQRLNHLMLQLRWERYLLLSSMAAGDPQAPYTVVGFDERAEPEDNLTRAVSYLLDRELLEARGASGRMRVTVQGRNALDEDRKLFKGTGVKSPGRKQYQACLARSLGKQELDAAGDKPRRLVKSGHTDPIMAGLENLSWGEIVIQFVDGSAVRIKVRGKSYKYDFSEMGFKDDRTGRANHSWELLRDISEKNGRLERPKKTDPTAFRQKKAELSRNLRRFFGLQVDPLQWNAKERAWIAEFRIRPETDRGEFSPALKISIPPIPKH